MDFITALLGGVSGGLAAGLVLRRRPDGSTHSQDWYPDAALTSDIERTIHLATADPTKQELLRRKLLLGSTILHRGRRLGRRRT